MTRIYLIRHGRVEWNIDNAAYVGSTDLPLDEVGEEQARSLASRMKGVELSAVYSSNKIRSVKTAQLIAREHGLEVQIVPELAEIDYGRWEGLSARQMREGFAELYERWRKDPEHVAPPDGETIDSLRSRVLPAVDAIVRRHPDQVVAVVAHKTVNRMLICHFLDMSISRYKEIGQDNAAVNIMRFSGNRVALETVNDVCHTRR